MVSTLKGYLVHEKIKDGSIGTVWRATNGANQVFALKQLSVRHARIGRKLRGFKREATLTQKLVHPKIVRVHEYVAMDPQPFFVMEYFQSENLKFVINETPAVIRGREFSVLRQIAEGLAFVHSRGVVHRDMKPENVLVNESGDLRIIDFSLSQTWFDRLLQFGRRPEGTPLYMAPEQVRGEKCDPRTDIYGFGALAYEIFAKRPPFLAPSEAKVLEAQLRETPRAPSAFGRAVSPDVDRFVLSMLSKRRADRPQSMVEVLGEISTLEKKLATAVA